MAHKVKEVKLSEAELQQKKTTHYEKYIILVEALKGERAKENQKTEQIFKVEEILKGIREVIDNCNADVKAKPFRMFIANWALQYSDREKAMKLLYEDQEKFEKQLAILKTQRKMNIERQVELENMLRKYEVFNPW